MEHKNAIEVFGVIDKLETVLSIDRKVLPGSLVFEAIAPFPGYYHEAPHTTKPVYLYLALQERHNLIDLIRITEQVEKAFGERFDAGMAFIKIYNDTYTVLRIRHLNRYDLIGDLQKLYQEHGIMFLQKTKKGLDEEAHIRVIKFFNLAPLDEGIYLDSHEEFHAYLEIPRRHEWDEFNDLTNRVKYNWEESKFDAAMGAFYHEGRLHEFVRIYSNKLSPDYLKGLHRLYLRKIKEPLHS